MGRYSDYIKNKNKNNKEEENKTSSSGGYAKHYLEKQFGIDTFESDLAEVGNTINSIYGGWQTQETMANTRSVVESMQKRINAYQTYQSKYGGTDLSDLAKGYQT